MGDSKQNFLSTIEPIKKKKLFKNNYLHHEYKKEMPNIKNYIIENDIKHSPRMHSPSKLNEQSHKDLSQTNFINKIEKKGGKYPLVRHEIVNSYGYKKYIDQRNKKQESLKSIPSILYPVTHPEACLEPTINSFKSIESTRKNGSYSSKNQIHYKKNTPKQTDSFKWDTEVCVFEDDILKGVPLTKKCLSDDHFQSKKMLERGFNPTNTSRKKHTKVVKHTKSLSKEYLPAKWKVFENASKTNPKYKKKAKKVSTNISSSSSSEFLQTDITSKSREKPMKVFANSNSSSDENVPPKNKTDSSTSSYTIRDKTLYYLNAIKNQFIKSNDTSLERGEIVSSNDINKKHKKRNKSLTSIESNYKEKSRYSLNAIKEKNKKQEENLFQNILEASRRFDDLKNLEKTNFRSNDYSENQSKFLSIDTNVISNEDSRKGSISEKGSKSLHSHGAKIFKLRFNMSEYPLNNIVVKTVDHVLQVYAKQEMLFANNAEITEYKKEFILPKNTLFGKISPSITENGILTVSVPIPVENNSNKTMETRMSYSWTTSCLENVSLGI